MKKKELCYIIIFSFILAFLLLSTGKGVARIALDHNNSSKKASIETYLKENVKGKNFLTETLGEVHNVLGLNVIGNFDYVRDDQGIMQKKENQYSEQQSEEFVKSIKDLKSSLGDVPVIFVQYPDRGSNFKLNETIYYFGKTPNDISSKLIASGIDVLNLESYLSNEQMKKYFFVSDIHLSTQAEFENAKIITNYLNKKYSINFPATQKVYNLDNWVWNKHVFWGNLGRTSGKLFSGTDIFLTFTPKFITNLRLSINDSEEKREGDFKNVMTNSFEDQHNESLYWVINYGQFPHPMYKYENLNLVDAPNLLVICDSLAMRMNTFLAMNASSITVLDPRAFQGKDYLNIATSNQKLDAVIIMGSDSKFYQSALK